MNEYTGLKDDQLEVALEEAVEADDWEAASKIQLANVLESFAGLSVKYQGNFIDKR